MAGIESELAPRPQAAVAVRRLWAWAWPGLPIPWPILLYLAVMWCQFLGMQLAGVENVQRASRPYSFYIHHIFDDPVRAAWSSLTAPFLAFTWPQAIYVTVIFVFIGTRVFRQFGTFWGIVLFFATSILGAVGAGLALHIIYPHISDWDLFRRAMYRSWGGGSVAGFGFAAIVAARSRHPWRYVGLVMLWEANVVFWELRSYTTALHNMAFWPTFIIFRWVIRGPLPSPRLLLRLRRTLPTSGPPSVATESAGAAAPGTDGAPAGRA
ncbi:MAG: hypothetical protein RMK15_08780 [Chloroflexota bacterium]|nr:hypothetical protein [Dehalococcoidia bacterium]MDW8047356.1 hypothetical protein [Chloroflexota bacterium]